MLSLQTQSMIALAVRYVVKIHWASALNISSHEPNWLLDIVHSDLIGAFSPATYSGKRYAIMYINGFSGYIMVRLMMRKS
jgi:hypothetical protein